ncbi:MAG: DNA modification methylase [Prevotellaceae bacterium]|jgi:hypothetical protein|nr:DNA modification methylase [Prevotellaceae bacterium]
MQFTVGFLKANSGKKGEGMPVVRNPQFYFKEGFCWTLINGTRSENDLKFRLSTAGVYDVGGMSLHSVMENIISQKFIVCICNSNLISRYTESFVNFTVNFQINDARQIPIIVPTKEELMKFEALFDSAARIKKEQFSNQISINGAENRLFAIQNKLDNMVYELYGII